MKKLIVISASLFFLLSSCAVVPQRTVAGFENRANALIGLTDAELVRKMGVPNSTYKVGESTFYLYSHSQQTIHEDNAPVMYNNIMVYKRPTEIRNWTCDLTLEVKNEKVVYWSSKGNNCKD